MIPVYVKIYHLPPLNGLASAAKADPTASIIFCRVGTGICVSYNFLDCVAAMECQELMLHARWLLHVLPAYFTELVDKVRTMCR